MSFAVNPEDFGKHIFVTSGGDVDDQATLDDFINLKDVCEKNGSHVAIVVDAEGEIICFAPVAVARIIAKLLDESGDFGDDLLTKKHGYGADNNGTR